MYETKIQSKIAVEMIFFSLVFQDFCRIVILDKSKIGEVGDGKHLFLEAYKHKENNVNIS